MTVGDALARAGARLRAHPFASDLDAAWLLAGVLERDAAWLRAHAGAPLTPRQQAEYDAAIARRSRGEPVAYIQGRAGFYGRTFAVDPRVLVPRPESEHVVERALAYLRGRGLATPRVCDVGTGSGALAITLACEVPSAIVVATDVSADALAVAAANARAFGVAARIALRCGDLFAMPEGNERYDTIVANLPYVRTDELAQAPDPTSFEPRAALDGGLDGLDAYRRLLARAPARLGAAGLLVMEAGPDTAAELAALARDAFEPGTRVTLDVDYARRERLVSVERVREGVA